MGPGDPVPAVIELNRRWQSVYCYVQLANALGLRYWQVGHDDFSYVSGSFVANVSGVMEALREAGALRPPPLVSS
jgi:hypothetical protein